MKLFDAHCDTIYQCYKKHKDLLKENPNGHLDLKRSESLSKYAQFFALFEDGKGRSPFEMSQIFRKQYDVFRVAITNNKDRIKFCKTAHEANQAFAQGRHAAFLSVEGAELLACDIDMLEDAFAMGVRSVTLTWNHANALSGSAVEETTRGLSKQGKRFVERMQKLSMLVDVSHMSQAGFWDVLDIAQAPIIASHSNFKSLCNHHRNVTDEQFIALKNNGGVLGLNYYRPFLGENATIDGLVSQVEHAWYLGGQDHIALGSDFDGCDILPIGMNGIEDTQRLYDALLQRNYSEIWVENLFYKNLMRVVSEVCTT